VTSPNDVMAALTDPGDPPGNMQTGMSSHQRLSMAMRLANERDPANVPDPVPRQLSGIPNPYGRRLDAYEPNNIVFQDLDQRQAAQDAAKAKADATKSTTTTISAPPFQGTGQLAGAISAAMGLAARQVPYVWGGTSSNGVDCSGLLFYAFNSAGIHVPRYRAVDWGKVGVDVGGLANARPGDVVFYDEGGGAGHVGLYIGGGKMIAAPQTGDHVRVQTVYGTPTSIRRVVQDDKLESMATPNGLPGFAYNGLAYNPAGQPVSSQQGGSTIYERPIHGSIAD